MNIKCALVLFAFLMLFSFSGAGGQEPPVFSNDDLENYKLPTYDKISVTGDIETPEKEEIKRKARVIQEQEDQEYWCKKAAAATKLVEKSRKSLKDSEFALSESTNSLLMAGGRKKKMIEKEIKKIEQTLRMDRTRLREREEDLAELEGEAHRKGIPPGWLRCQFE